MAKKGKKKGKKGKRQKDPREALPDSIKAMDISTLQREIEVWRQKMFDTKVLRNKNQNEKDLIKQFYDVTKSNSEQTKALIRIKDTDMEKLEDDHRVEVKVYMQKIKHLEYDHQTSLKKLEIDSKETVKEEYNYHISTENKAKILKKSLKKDINELDTSNVGKVDKEILTYQRELNTLKEIYDKQIDDIEKIYKEKLQNLKENLELRLKVEIHEVEERKNKHRNELMVKHEKAFRSIKDYYNNITRGNLEKIKELKEEKKKLEQNQTDHKIAIEDLKRENETLKTPLEETKAELNKLEDKLTNYNLDKVSLFNAKKHHKTLLYQLEKCKYDKKELESKYQLAATEKDELFKRYESTVDRVKQKSDYKNVYLEQKLKGLEDNLQRKETQLQEVLAKVNLEPGFVVEINKRIEESLEAKNVILKNLKYSLSHAIKAYNDAIRVYEAKLVEFGIPPEELGFQPIESNTSTMPAGLVAA
jgi:growth arrest-specific protein 8